MSHPRIETMPQWPFGERQNKAILNHTEIQKLVEGPTIQSQHEMNKSENVFSKTSNYIYTLYVYCISSLQLLPTTHCLNHVICNMSLYTQYVYSSGHNQSIYQILLVSSRFNKEVVRFQRVATRCHTCLVFRASSIYRFRGASSVLEKNVWNIRQDDYFTLLLFILLIMSFH